MTYIKCDRCGTKLAELQNQTQINIMPNYNIEGAEYHMSVDLCEKCTKQFFNHFMKNHWKEE